MLPSKLGTLLLASALTALGFGCGAVGGSASPCSVDHGGCDQNAACVDTPEGAVCTCLPGYSGNGLSCLEVDPCATADGGDACAAPDAGSPAACDASSCPSGCCSGSGTCLLGTSSGSCGTGGEACSSCLSTGGICVSQSCTGGVDAGSDGGVTGAACSFDLECAALGTGAHCRTSTATDAGTYSGGYCTKICWTDNPCDADAICTAFAVSDDEPEALCTKKCQPPSSLESPDCRTGYACFPLQSGSDGFCWVYPAP